MKTIGAKSLPQEARLAGEEQRATAAHEPHEAYESHEPQHVLVLIADDEEPIAETLALIVEEAGFAAITALHGQAAIELVRQCRPALIITDLMMPLMDGKALIMKLREEATRAGWPPIPVILMTAADLHYARTCEADAVLAKPFNLHEVEYLLRRFLPVSG